MKPDPKKVKVVHNWLQPTDVTAVQQFLSLASYYHWYILGFAQITTPFHMLTKKGESFSWSTECDHAFCQLKLKLLQAPVLSYPEFDSEAKYLWCIHIGVAATGIIGAVLEQNGHVVAYVCCALTKSEC